LIDCVNCEALARAAKVNVLAAVLEANKEAAYLAQQTFMTDKEDVG